MNSVVDAAKIVLNEIVRIWKEYKPLERIEPLKHLQKEVKSCDETFFNQFLEGLYKYFKLHRKRKKIRAELEYPEEKRNREKVIGIAREVQYLLNQARMKLELLDLPEALQLKFENWCNNFIYYANMQECKQRIIIYMHDGDFGGAKEEAEEGLGKASSFEDRNYFAGLRSECEAYKTLIEKRWWEISDKDFKDAIQSLEAAVDCYDRCRDEYQNEYEYKDNIMSVPMAMISLLKFMISPTLGSVSNMVRFCEIRDKYPTVQYAFRPVRKSTSERKKQRNLIMQYLKNVVYKIAAFNIFEELRTIIVELENFAWKTDAVYQKIAKEIPDRASIYKGKHAPSIEVFVDHCKDLFGNNLPKSIATLRDIYHDCKHKTVYITYTPEPDKFAEELVNRILSVYDVLKNLRMDIEHLKGYFIGV